MDPERDGRTRRQQRRSRERLWRLSSGDDLEGALMAAERLLHEAEERRRHEQNITYAIVSVIVITVLSLAASLVVVVEVATFGQTTRLFAAVISFIAASIILLWLFIALQRHRRNVASKFILRLAVQASSLVAAALVDVAEREEWSYLRTEATKLRLSAFPLLESDRHVPGQK